MTRAAIFYLGATLAGCDGSSEPEPEESIVQPYGAPPDPQPPESEESIVQPYGAPPDPQPPEPEPPEPEPEQQPAPSEATEPAQAEPGLDDSVLEGTVGQPYGGGALPP